MLEPVAYHGLAILECIRPSENTDIMVTRRYSPLRGLTSSSCGGLRPSAKVFFALRAKKEANYDIFGVH